MSSGRALNKNVVESSSLIRIWVWNPKNLTPLNIPQVIANAKKKIDDQCFTASSEKYWGSLSGTSVEAGAKNHHIYYTENIVIFVTSTEGNTEE